MDDIATFWKPVYNAFSPVGVVDPADVSRFFVDRSQSDPTASIVQRLRIGLQNSIGQRKHYKGLLTGHVGTGKTFELIRLGQELRNDFFVVVFAGDTSLAVETANQFDVLLGMGVAVYKAARSYGLNPNRGRITKLLRSMAKFVRKFDQRREFTLNLDQLLKQVAVVGGAAVGGFVGGPPGAAVGAAVLGAATHLQLKVGDELVQTLELPANRDEVISALNEVMLDVETQSAKPVLVITDGLDKTPPGRARMLFADSPLLTEPACAMLYAAPIEFYHRLSAGTARNLFDVYSILPNPPVQTRPATGDDWRNSRAPNQAGLSVMRQVLEQRLRALAHDPDDVISADARTMLAVGSGGVMREFVRNVREAGTTAHVLGVREIDEEVARRVLAGHRQQLMPMLTVARREAIKRVLHHGALCGAEHEAVEDELIRSLHLLSYHGADDAWFDAHPNVLPLL